MARLPALSGRMLVNALMKAGFTGVDDVCPELIRILDRGNRCQGGTLEFC